MEFTSAAHIQEKRKCIKHSSRIADASSKSWASSWIRWHWQQFKTFVLFRYWQQPHKLILRRPFISTGPEWTAWVSPCWCFESQKRSSSMITFTWMCAWALVLPIGKYKGQHTFLSFVLKFHYSKMNIWLFHNQNSLMCSRAQLLNWLYLKLKNVRSPQLFSS